MQDDTILYLIIPHFTVVYELAGDILFSKSVETDHVDVFIGHSWSAGRWLKVLALCVHFNLGLAVGCSMLTWFTTGSLLPACFLVFAF